MRSMKFLTVASVIVCTLLAVRFSVHIEEPQKQLTDRDHPFFDHIDNLDEDHIDNLDEPLVSIFRMDSHTRISRLQILTYNTIAMGVNADVFERKILYPSVPIDLEIPLFETDVNSEHLLPPLPTTHSLPNYLPNYQARPRQGEGI